MLAAAQHRALLAAGVVELVHPPAEDGRRVRLVEGLQLNFALNQPLSAYALAVFDTLDPDKWELIDTSRPTNNSLQDYLPEQISVKDGKYQVEEIWQP